jgi:hypothetical protein
MKTIMSLAKLEKNCNCNRKMNGGSMKKMIVSLMLIISMFAFAAESAPSATVGYVKYSNVLNATTTDFNQIALPMLNTWTMSNLIDPASAYFSTISKWNATTQAYATSNYSLGSWKSTFAIAPGDPLMVNAKQTADLVVSGSLTTVQYNLINNAALTDFNHMMLPLSKTALSTTALLGADIGSGTYVSTISKWNNVTQAYATSNWSLGSWKSVYNTYIGDPLLLNITAAKTWPTVAGKYEDMPVVDSDDNAIPKAGLPRTVAINVADAVGNYYDIVADYGTVTWYAYITARPADILRWNTATYCYEDTKSDGSLCVAVPLSEFVGVWTGGETLHIAIKDELTNTEAYLDIPLDLDGNEYLVGFDTEFGAGNDNPLSPTNIVTLLDGPASIDGANIPTVTKLHQNYPNPFNPTTSIKFDLTSNSVVKLNVYNYNGQLVKSLVNGQMNAGYHTVNFDASSLSAGVYYYTMETAGKSMTQKMVLVK